MSNYHPTPSSGGPSSYTQQWPPANPSSSAPIPSFLPNMPYNPNPSPLHHFQHDPSSYPYDYTNEVNFNANSRLPGLGAPATPGPLPPPPPFPFMAPFTTPQFPPPPFPGQIPPLRYPPIPPPSSFNAPPSRPSTGDFQPHHNSGPPNNSDSLPANTSGHIQDLEREEGELTDKEGGLAQQDAKPRAITPASSGNRLGHTAAVRNSQAVNGRNGYSATRVSGSGVSTHKGARRRSQELEEGELSSPESHSSSRDSGSPYNPPVTVNTDAIDKMDLDAHAPTKPPYENISEKPIVPQSGVAKAPAQLRVQAQGALLGLAPHNIRYSELVGEGINPTVLKQLYEEVGIKVLSPQADVSPASELAPSVESNSVASEPPRNHEQEGQLTGTVKIDEDSAQRPSAVEAVVAPVPPPASQPDPAKPMERKELIARMLAAKAAKTSAAPEPPQKDVPKAPPIPHEASATANIDEPAAAALPSSEMPAKDKEVKIKEKNKAQTELARQRIEELKKGLMRNQQKSQPETFEQPTSQFQDSDISNSSGIQHPLPERPPDPESNASARIPGLFMTDSKEEDGSDSYVTPVQGLVVDSTLQPRVNQRKRPRASDFDEPISIPSGAFHHNGSNHTEDRLIIDISEDDEFYGDEDSMDIEDYAGSARETRSAVPESVAQTFPSMDSLPPRTVSSSQGFATPHQNGRSNDPEHLRKKNLEIQAMRRRIAELEQRKKAKLTASRTQSPRAIDLAPLTPPEPSIPPDTETRNVESTNSQDSSSIQEMTAEPSATPLQNGPPSSSAQDTLLMDIDHFEKMKSKLLRKQEIESGVPALDAEIRKSEARLAEFKNEEEKVLLEIARGKEGRQQLWDELHNINLELNGLSMEEVETALHRLKSAAEQKQVNHEAPAHQEIKSNGNEVSVPAPPTDEVQSQEDTGVSGQSVVTSQEPPANAESSPFTHGNTKEADSSHESSANSSNESQGSAMEESSDSDGESSMSIDPEETKEDQLVVPEHSAPEATSEPLDLGQEETTDQQSTSPHHPLPERPPVADTQDESGLATESGEDVAMSEDDTSSQSSASEAYEPPEADANASPAESVYTPPFSPASPGPIEPSEEATEAATNQLRDAGEPLTEKVQELDAQPSSENTQVGLLDNSGQPEDPQHDKILVQMGSVREGKTPEEKDNYIAGLKQIINELRRVKVKDFNTVADEIAAYRRRFLNDASRILPL